MTISAKVRNNRFGINARVTTQDNVLVVNYSKSAEMGKLGDLTNVDVASATDNQVLSYNANSDIWTAETVVFDGGEY